MLRHTIKKIYIDKLTQSDDCVKKGLEKTKSKILKKSSFTSSTNNEALKNHTNETLNKHSNEISQNEIIQKEATIKEKLNKEFFTNDISDKNIINQENNDSSTINENNEETNFSKTEISETLPQKNLQNIKNSNIKIDNNPSDKTKSVVSEEKNTKKGNRFSLNNCSFNQKLIALICCLAVIIIGGISIFSFSSKKLDSSTEKISSFDNPSTAEVTATVTPTETPVNEVNMIAVGDNLYHLPVVWTSGKSAPYNFDHIYTHVKSDIEKADIAAVNQETVFTKEGQSPEGYPTFATPKEVAQALYDTGFDVIEQASNHTADQGDSGIQRTIEVWNAFDDITVLGINKTKEDAQKISVVEKNNIKIAMLNYTFGLNGNSCTSYMVNLLDETRINSDVSKAKKQADFVIAFVHWGTEYTFEPIDSQEKWTNIFAEAGVDVVIGAHPHVIEPVEWVQSSTGHDMLVYYSLGNFISRQTEPSRLLGGMAHITFTKKDNQSYISYAGVSPTFMHYENTPSKAWSVYNLEDYPAELESKHGVKNLQSSEKFSLEKIKTLSKKIFGSTTEIEIKK